MADKQPIGGQSTPEEGDPSAKSPAKKPVELRSPLRKYVGPALSGMQKIVLPVGRPVRPHLMTDEEVEAFLKVHPEYAGWWE